MRYLGIDLGDKRTGLAVGDDETRFASPAGLIALPAAGEPLIEAIAKAAHEHDAGALVIGLPLNMDDSEGPRTKLVRGLASKIQARSGLPIHFQDERLTSVEADWSMARSGLTHGQKKSRRDAIAAAAILSDFLASLPREGQA